ARHLVDAAAVAGSTRAIVCGSGVNGSKTSQHPGPVIVIELIRPEVRAGEAIVLRAVVSIVLVRSKGESSKAAVIGDVCGQPIMVTEQDRFAIAHLGELGRKSSLERPHPVCILSWETRMKFSRNWCGRINPGIQV